MKNLFLLLALLLLVSGVLAQNSGYDLLDQSPVPGMLPIGTTLHFEAFDAASNTLRQRSGRIEHYVRWNQPIRPPEYYIVLRDESCGDFCAWFIWSRTAIETFS